LGARAPIGLEVFDGVFDRSAELVQYLDGLGRWQRSEVSGNDAYASEIRTSSSLGMPFLSYSNPPLVHDFAKCVWQFMSNYAFAYGIAVQQYEPIVFNRYEPGQKFDMHPDYFRGSDRVFSAVCYLNTVADGGSTTFGHFDYEVAAVEGRLVIFPSNYLFAHAGVAPVSEVKYSAAFWARA
jgi:hypothetical protein